MSWRGSDGEVVLLAYFIRKDERPAVLARLRAQRSADRRSQHEAAIRGRRGRTASRSLLCRASERQLHLKLNFIEEVHVGDKKQSL